MTSIKEDFMKESATAVTDVTTEVSEKGARRAIVRVVSVVAAWGRPEVVSWGGGTGK
jgi:hypothetical protein